MEKRRHILQHLLDVPLHQNPAVRPDLGRYEKVQISITERKGDLLPEVAEDHPRITRVLVLLGASLTGKGKVDLLGCGACLHDDRPARLVCLAKVDPGLVEFETGNGCVGRNVLEEELRLTARSHNVGLVDHRADTVGIEESFVLPIASGKIDLLQLPNGQHHLGRSTFGLVAVGVDHPQRVVGPKLLEVLVGSRQHRGVPESKVVNRQSVGLDILSGEVFGCPERPHLNLVQAPGRTGELEVVLDVRRLLLQGRRGDLETLDNCGIDGTGGDGHHDPGTDRYGCERPAPSEDVDNEQDRSDQGHQNQQPICRQPGGHVGEARSEESLGPL